MTDRQAIILAELKAKIEASKAAVKLRLVDRAFAQWEAK